MPMERRFPTDGSGRWFDVEEAEYWEGESERLYNTPDENFILRSGNPADLLGAPSYT